jgi:hypothetical protein
MRFITETYPNFCPKCGVKRSRPPDMQDWEAGCAHVCDCGAEWQRVPDVAIICLAAAHGDSWKYWAPTPIKGGV